MWKKIISISLSIFMIFSLSACSNETINTNADAIATYEQDGKKTKIEYFKNGDKVSKIIHTNILKLDKIDSKTLENIEKIAKKFEDTQKSIKGLKYNF
ncbi:DUF1307 domain-containing protein, partial [Helcococcus ovis]|uniref:DUF1307 domain-containing protein n=1 Tax=Helcococcus ovis TaxID=72026 RepID=UPI0038BBB4EA